MMMMMMRREGSQTNRPSSKLASRSGFCTSFYTGFSRNIGYDSIFFHFFNVPGFDYNLN